MNAPINWWQTGMSPPRSARSSMVEACVSAYAQTVAMCPGNHWRWAADTGRQRVPNSPLARIIKRPNDYQSVSDFLLNLVRYLLDEGNAYALVVRNNRFEPIELHLMDSDSSHPVLAVDGSIFYSLAGNPIVDRRFGPRVTVPARDVLHIRLHTPRHPLVGETPMVAAALELAAGNAALSNQVNFFLNQSRPSFILSTDASLTIEQVRMLRTAWDEQSKGLNSGGTPILSNGLKPNPIGSSNKDAELASILRLSSEAIAQVYRVPLQVLGAASTAYATTEALMQSWRAGGLGFLLNHIEEAIGNLFKLGGQPEEYLELDTSALLRSEFKVRVEGWAAGTQAGIFDRNVARQDFELAPVKGGEEPWVQQQDIPLSVAAEMAKNPPPPPALPDPPAEPEPDAEADAEQARAFIALFEKDFREALNA
ncbi:phage portal protein [Sphingomonas lacusdianchii]|uniref:phage portal protein n=1 Tax=Sphingomonas lacusdianchii TaxID=2917992 RepID=UPI001F594E3D|nr:phage portal protein [Sphingomonas sp. JXJ CY 53]